MVRSPTFVVLLSATLVSALAQAQDDTRIQGDTPSPNPPAASAGQPTTALAAGGDRQTPPKVAVWAGYGQSDNIARTELEQIDGSYDSVGTLLSLAHKSRRID